MTDRVDSFVTKLIDRGLNPVDNASVTFFRICFGLISATWAWDYLSKGLATQLYVNSPYHFTYYLLDWVKPLPGDLIYLHFLVLLLAAVCIAIGFLYRISSFVWAIGFTYFFLIDRTSYQNHYYLMVLISWWLPFLPLNRNVSVDAWHWPQIRSEFVSSWVLWIIQFHIGVPYFFGGIAKIVPDWFFGAPLVQMMASKSDLPFVGELLGNPSIGLILAWGGLVFDLAVVPMLIWKKTRVIAYCFCIVFHLMNAVIFNIHIFPWFMLAATPVFFEPDWPRRVLGGARLELSTCVGNQGAPSFFQRLIACGILGYLTFHCLWPLRHHLYPGDASWNERGHYFAWRMMLRGKSVVLGYAIHDKVTGKTVDGNVNRFLNPEQSEKFGRDPEMILQFAHFLGNEYKKTTGHDASVYVLALASLNGRKPELMIDPNVDLMREPRGFDERAWLMPQTEPLRQPFWDVPVDQWRNYVKIPELRFLTHKESEALDSDRRSVVMLDKDDDSSSSK